MKVVFSSQIEERWMGKGNTFRAKDVTARAALEQHYLRYPHLIPRHLKEHMNAVRSAAAKQETQKETIQNISVLKNAQAVEPATGGEK